MKERPILFNGEMVRAVLDGGKTQTRRVVKPDIAGCLEDGWGNEVQKIETDETPMGGLPVTEWCPYGRIGNHLWVRETFAVVLDDNGKEQTIYRSSCPSGPYGSYMVRDAEYHGPWKPSIFMPRWASRIMLEVTVVRVERLQDITYMDAYREGVWRNQYDCLDHFMGIKRGNPVKAFEIGWDSINGKPRKNGVDISWSANPWVWVVEFKMIKGGAQ